MDLRTLSRVSGVLGGACWLARFVLDPGGAGGDVLYWVGLLLLFVALADLGAGLVSKSATWLRAIVGVAFPLLVWSVLEAMDPGTDASAVDGVFGAVIAGLSVFMLSRDRQRPPRRHHGAHAR